MFDHIEKLKHEWTDQYVAVEGASPELARFSGLTGKVRTVNMSGRALVEFDAWANIGWYDIDLSYLRVTEKPDPNAVKEAPAQKPAEKAPAAKGGEAAKAGGKPSVADILAAARANKPAAGASGGAAAKPAAAKPAAAPSGGKMSTADILAAARGKAAAKAESAPAAKAESEATSEAPAAPVEKPVAKAKPASGGALPKDTAGIIAWCREHDKQ